MSNQSEKVTIEISRADLFYLVNALQLACNDASNEVFKASQKLDRIQAYASGDGREKYIYGMTEAGLAIAQQNSRRCVEWRNKAARLAQDGRRTKITLAESDGQS